MQTRGKGVKNATILCTSSMVAPLSRGEAAHQLYGATDRICLQYFAATARGWRRSRETVPRKYYLGKVARYFHILHCGTRSLWRSLNLCSLHGRTPRGGPLVSTEIAPRWSGRERFQLFALSRNWLTRQHVFTSPRTPLSRCTPSQLNKIKEM